MTYAAFWIKQSITRYIENNGRSIRMPSHMHSKVQLYKKAVTAYEIQLGRKPTDRELCRYIGVNQGTLQDIKKANLYDGIQSLDEYIPGTEDILLGDSVPDRSVDIENDVIDGMIEKSKRTELWEIVKDNVTPEQNVVIVARFRKSMSLDATSQMIGKTREMVRQIEAKALRKLRLSRITRKLEEKFEVNYARAYRGSVSSFKYTGTSITEYIALCNLGLEGIK